MRRFTKIAIAVFLLIAVLHLLRVIFGWEVIISGIIIPLWASVIGFIVAAGLAVLLWKEMKGK
jgi:membrane associated rhomboid family serine protease